MALVKSKYIDLSAAPWTMHDFFAGSGLVGYGLNVCAYLGERH